MVILQQYSFTIKFISNRIFRRSSNKTMLCNTLKIGLLLNQTFNLVNFTIPINTKCVGKIELCYIKNLLIENEEIDDEWYITIMEAQRYDFS